MTQCATVLWKTERAKLPPLTQRQDEILSRLRKGESNKEIAAGLGIAHGTVKVHVAALFRKLGARNRTQAAVLSNRKRRR